MKDHIVYVCAVLGSVVLFLYALDGYSEALEKRQNYGAKCESVGGKYGRSKCYVNGVEFNLEGVK